MGSDRLYTLYPERGRKSRSVCLVAAEDRTELARGGLSGNPAPRERAERGWTPGVSARSAMQEGSG